LAQLSSWLDPELVDEEAASCVIGVESLRLAPGAVERAHQLAAQVLSERMLRDQGLELARELRMVSELKLGPDPLLDCDQVQLFQPGDLGLGERLVGEIGERGAPPERERLGEQIRGLARSTGSEGASAFGEQGLEAMKVELAGLEAEHIPGGGRLEQPIGLEQLPQL